jgi:endonuclease YncB( thermonuclease family)
MTTTATAHEPMSTLDRCDKCGAQALVRATLANGELYFCGHHGREMSNNLVASALVVYDPEGVFNYGRKI